MAGLTVSGLGSGLDIRGMVSQLIAAEGLPTTNRLNRQEAKLQAELSALGSFKAALAELGSAVGKLTNVGTFEGMKTGVSDTALLSANAGNQAQAGVYGVEVVQLARAQSLASGVFDAPTDFLGSGTITIELGTYDADSNAFIAKPDATPQTLSIDETSNTLADVRDAINQADLGATASIVNDGVGYRLTLRSNHTGEENTLRISVTDDDGTDTDGTGLSRLAFDPTAAAGTGKNLTETVTAQNAVAVVEGLTIKGATNTISEAIQGVTLELKSPGSAKITVERDTGAAVAAVSGLVETYNRFLNIDKELTAYNPETRQGGALLGDATVRSITGQLRRILGSAMEVGDFGTLSELGISTERNGTLKLDSSQLKAAVEENPAGVAALFTQSEDGDEALAGIADRLDKFLENVLGSNSPLDNRTDTINTRMDRIGEQRLELDQRLSVIEKRYLAQFNAMDQLIGQLNATGNFLTQQLASLPGFQGSKDSQ